jgi:acyl dehydratase
MKVFESVAELRAAAGEHLGFSEWHTIDQAQITAFADATGDHQWIHVDPERAAQGPFGTTIAHGYLVLSMLPILSMEVYRVDGLRMGLNYGLNRVRFPAPVPAGSKIRAAGRLLSVEDANDGGVQVILEATVEREGGEKPCCVAETIARLYA